jgi:uncharacterized membrane protein
MKHNFTNFNISNNPKKLALNILDNLLIIGAKLYLKYYNNENKIIKIKKLHIINVLAVLAIDLA